MDKLLSYFAILIFVVWAINKFFIKKKGNKKDDTNDRSEK